MSSERAGESEAGFGDSSPGHCGKLDASRGGLHTKRVDYVCAEGVERFRNQVVDPDDGSGSGLEELAETVVDISCVDVSHEAGGTFEVPSV